MTAILDKNPFQITTPEDLTAQETVNLFVDVFTDFQKIIDPGHVFLIGPRGAGKSMMFRYLQPDCQRIAKNCTLTDLPFFGIYVPLKNTNFALAELKRLEHRHASDILNEHIMVTHFCVKIFETLANSRIYSEGNITGVNRFYLENFLPSLRLGTSASFDGEYLDDDAPAAEVFSRALKIVEDLYMQAMAYTKKLAFCHDFIPYDGPLYDYLNFLFPLITALADIPGFPSGTVYLLIDDAHCLTDTQARILNSWVATRTSRKVSLKISTQYNYKTYYTTTGATIDTPHDYSEIDMTTIYTGSSKSKYRERITDIVKKRLDAFGITGVTADEFFPEDVKQEKAIQRIEEEYKLEYDRGKGRGYYRSDDALRYARPDFIKSLSGTKKASSKYSYAGFSQLVHLSSGIVRHFIHPAYLMYAKARSQSPENTIQYIPSAVQDEIIREEANSFLFNELDRVKQEGHDEATPKENITKLSNLIQGLGGVFRQILISEGRAERRVFSIAFSDTITDDVNDILNLGVQLGYFHKSTIGRKDSKSGGRTRLYILNRRLAPIWNLDPNGFAGYLFVTNKLIQEAMEHPISLLRRIDKHGISDDTAEVVQLELFSEGE